MKPIVPFLCLFAIAFLPRLHRSNVQPSPPVPGVGTTLQAAATKTTVEAAKASRDLLERRIAEGVPGFSVAVAIDGQVVWTDALGVADLESKSPVTPATRFRIGSTSKSVTAALAGRLLERGVIDLDADIAESFAGFPRKQYPITLRNLLSSQAGIRHYKGLESFNQEHFESVAAGLVIFQEDPLLFEPGTEARYSSYGFNLAGAVMAAAAGTDFGGALEREVFAPLGMKESGVDDPTLDIPERASFYTPRGSGAIHPSVAVDDSYKAPSGGLVSTARDIATFGAALLEARGKDAGDTPWLSSDTVNLLFTRQQLADGSTPGYALGFRVRPIDPSLDPPTPWAVHHGGSSIGGRSMLFMLPEERIAVSILCNSDGYDTKEKDAEAIALHFRNTL